MNPQQEKLKQIEGELFTINQQLKKNIKPEEPYRPIDPFLPKTHKPPFFGYELFFQLIWIIFLPTYIIKTIVTESFYLWNTVIFSIVVALLGMTNLYMESMRDYRKEKNKNLQWYKARKKDMENYQQEIRSYYEKLDRYEKEDLKNKQLKDRKEKLLELQQKLTENDSKISFKNFPSHLRNQGSKDFFFMEGDASSRSSAFSSTDVIKDKKVKQAVDSISLLSESRRSKLIDLFRKVQQIQQSQIRTSEKKRKIKDLLWDSQTPGAKLWIGAVLGTITGLAIFGTGGIGIVGLGGAVGVWGFLAGTGGGVLISSIIQNFEKHR